MNAQIKFIQRSKYRNIDCFEADDFDSHCLLAEALPSTPAKEGVFSRLCYNVCLIVTVCVMCMYDASNTWWSLALICISSGLLLICDKFNYTEYGHENNSGIF